MTGTPAPAHGSRGRGQSWSARSTARTGRPFGTEQALSAYATEADRDARLRAARHRLRDEFGLLATRARFGAESPVDLLGTERTLIQVQGDLAASDAGLVDDSVSAFRALGGGWRSDSQG